MIQTQATPEAIGMQTGGSQRYRTVVPGGAAGDLMAQGFGGWRQQLEKQTCWETAGQKPFHCLEDHVDVTGAGDFPGAVQRRLRERPDPGS